MNFDVNDIEEKLDIYRKMNIRVIQSGKRPDSIFAYLDTKKISGVFFELIQRKGQRI